METISTLSNNTLFCDKCGRPIGFKSYFSIGGWIICGICQWENGNKFIMPMNFVKKKTESDIPPCGP